MENQKEEKDTGGEAGKQLRTMAMLGMFMEQGMSVIPIKELKEHKVNLIVKEAAKKLVDMCKEYNDNKHTPREFAFKQKSLWNKVVADIISAERK